MIATHEKLMHHHHHYHQLQFKFQIMYGNRNYERKVEAAREEINIKLKLGRILTTTHFNI